MRGPRFLAVDGDLSGDALADAFVERYPKAREKHSTLVPRRASPPRGLSCCPLAVA